MRKLSSLEHGVVSLALLGTFFLITSLITATAATNNPLKSYAINSFAKAEKTWRDIGNPKARQAARASAEADAAQARANPCLNGGCSQSFIQQTGAAPNTTGGFKPDGDISGYYRLDNGNYYPIAASSGGPSASDLAYVYRNVAANALDSSNPSQQSKAFEKIQDYVERGIVDPSAPNALLNLSSISSVNNINQEEATILANNLSSLLSQGLISQDQYIQAAGVINQKLTTSAEPGRTATQGFGTNDGIITREGLSGSYQNDEGVGRIDPNSLSGGVHRFIVEPGRTMNEPGVAPGIITTQNLSGSYLGDEGVRQIVRPLTLKNALPSSISEPIAKAIEAIPGKISGIGKSITQFVAEPLNALGIGKKPIPQQVTSPQTATAPQELKSIGTGKCLAHCDGVRMYDLYSWYKDQENGWWNKETNGNFTYNDFLAMMVLAESQGSADSETVRNTATKIAEAVSYQLWLASPENGRPGYCTTQDCQGGGGVLNFTGAYSQSAWLRYNALIDSNKNPTGNTLKGLMDQGLADYFANNQISFEEISNIIASKPEARDDYINLPTEWGCRGCGDPGLTWINTADKHNAPTGTTEPWGVYYMGKDGEVIYTLNQAAYWSNYNER